MISIGLPGNEMFAYNTPNIWNDQGGQIIFQGSFGTNPGASFVIRNNALLQIGNKSSFGQNLRILCSKEITIGKELLASWDITIMDTDSHYFKNMETEMLSESSKAITISSKIDKESFEEIINNKNCYFGISASQNISDIHVLNALLVKSLPSTFEEDINGTVANPLYGYIYIVVPSTFTFSITNNNVNVKNEFTKIRSELTPDKTTQLDVYRTSEIKYLDSPNHFNIVIS